MKKVILSLFVLLALLCVVSAGARNGSGGGVGRVVGASIGEYGLTPEVGFSSTGAEKGSLFVLLDTQDDGGEYRDVWGDGTYVYATCYWEGMRAYSFDGTSFTLLDSQDNGDDYFGVWGDGTYVYAACYYGGIRAYGFDGTNFTLLGARHDAGEYFDVWGDGTYVYAACKDAGIRVYSFDGSSFTLLDTRYDGGNYFGVWGDGTYVYTACRCRGIRAYGFDGTSFTLLDTQDDGGYYIGVWGDGTYVYAACDDAGIRAYGFDGTSFTLLDSQDDGGSYWGVWGDGTYVYAACRESGIRAYGFDGISFTLLDSQDDGGSYLGIWGDGTYVYAGCGEDGIRAYALFFPPVASFTFSPVSPTILDTIQFNDTSTDPDGNITSWFWDFDDGNTSILQNPTHQYDDPGVYYVSLTVTDDDGLTDTDSKYIYVTDPIPPEWRNQGQSETEIEPGDTINLYAQGRDNLALGWAWLATNETGEWQNFTGVEDWWDDEWSYRKQLNISNPIENYQMKINITKNIGGDIDCEGHCNDDFSDIRFVTTDSVELDYWIEEYSSGDYAVIWIETSGDESIYMYYGNPSALDVSDATATFIFFDDFLGTSLNTDIWDVDATVTGYSVANSKLTITSCADTWHTLKGFHTNISQQNSFSLEVKDFTWSQSGDSPMQHVGITLSNQTDAWTPLQVCFYDCWDFHRAAKRADIESNNFQTGYDNLGYSGTAQWRITKLPDNSSEIYWNDISLLGPYTSNEPFTKLYIRVNTYQTYGFGTCTIDRILMRRFVSSEPSWGAAGSEQMFGGGGSLYGSPMEMEENDEWQWSNFTWQNPSIPAETSVSWCICYSDLQGNVNCTDTMSFMITEYIRGDANGDGIVDVGDVVYLVSYLYRSGPAPDPVWVGDANSDGITDVGDIVYLVSYLYRGGPPPGCP